MVDFFQDTIDYIVKMFNVYAFLKNKDNLDFNDEEVRTYLFKSLIFSISVFISSIIIYYASTDGNSLTNKTFTYAFLIILPLILGIVYGANIVNLNDESYAQRFFIGAFTLFILIVIIYFLSISSSSVFTTINNVIVIIIVIIMLIGLALFYNVFSSYLKNQRGIIGFIINLIFYIPCLLNDLIIYIKGQVGITSSVVLVLFIIEILLILLYFYMPSILNLLEKKKSKTLLEEPIFLNKKQDIASSDVFKITEFQEMSNRVINQDTSNVSLYRNNNYAFSFWIYLNPEYNNNNTGKPINVFNYANGKPNVFVIDNRLMVKFTNNRQNTNENISDFDVTIPVQKWNNVTFNYLDNSVDLFVNGLLELSFHFNADNVPLAGTSTDIVSVGDDNGLSGSICNVKYYTESLTSSQISNQYNLLFPLNPPISKR